MKSCKSNPDKRWYVVETKPAQEEKALLYINKYEINTYFPKTETYHYKGFKRYRKIKPLFPRYIFAQCARRDVYYICWAKGVKKVLWENRMPESIPDELVYSIKALASMDGLIRRANFKKNDLVRVKSGPFKDILAIFDHWISDSERVCILLKLINAQIRVTLPAQVIEMA
ncbi:MAG: transcription termination/antitermination NusG family protein [Thermodesulfobacteriota bacterium]|nr:transcription termination/antitermination NusG family protein [Thermodesulfobacteriota bacterium]